MIMEFKVRTPEDEKTLEDTARETLARIERQQYKAPPSISLCYMVLLPKYCLIIRLESGDSDIGQGMLCHLLDHLVGYGGNIRPGFCTVNDMDGIADAGGDDPGVDIMETENLCNITDQVDTGSGHIIQPPRKGDT